MLKYLSIIFVIFLACGIASAKDKKMHPKEMFDHEMHTENFFAPAEVACETCHTNEAYSWEGMNHDGCHKCHTKTKPIMAATSDCSMCHRLWPVKPPDHRAGWATTHKTAGKLKPQTCKDCHNDRFCITCHKERTMIDQIMHRRNYEFFHSIDARANPKKCDRCHQVQFCTNCHTSRRGRW